MEIQGTSLQAQRHGTGQTEMSGISVVSHRRGKWKRVGKEFAECDANHDGESKGMVDSYR